MSGPGESLGRFIMLILLQEEIHRHRRVGLIQPIMEEALGITRLRPWDHLPIYADIHPLLYYPLCGLLTLLIVQCWKEVFAT